MASWRNWIAHLITAQKVTGLNPVEVTRPTFEDFTLLCRFFLFPNSFFIKKIIFTKLLILAVWKFSPSKVNFSGYIKPIIALLSTESAFLYLSEICVTAFKASSSLCSTLLSFLFCLIELSLNKSRSSSSLFFVLTALKSSSSNLSSRYNLLPLQSYFLFLRCPPPIVFAHHQDRL